EVRLRHPQILGLPARHRPVERGVAEQRRALALAADLCRFALRVQAARAHPARAARDVERHDDPITRGDVLDVRADLLDHAHRLVAEDVPWFQERSEHPVQVQIGSADRGGGHFDDGVGRFLDARIGYLAHRNAFVSLPSESFDDDSSRADLPGLGANRYLPNRPGGESAMTITSVADAVVIGAGHNGLVAANLLAEKGWDVVVCEQATTPGGAVASAEVTAPGFVTDLFSAFYPLAA